MFDIDIAMTAVLRPEVLDRTLYSFCNKLFVKRNNIRLIMNIDMVGENISPSEVEKVAAKYFNHLDVTVSETPNFPKAVYSVWSRCEANYVFHLEDDWHIERKVSLTHMLEILNKYDNLACLRLYTYPIANADVQKMFTSVYDYNPEGFFVARQREGQFGLQTNMIRIKFIKQVLPLFTFEFNPEKQFRTRVYPPLTAVTSVWDYAIYGKPGDDVLIKNIGDEWKNKVGLRKPTDRGSHRFLVWERFKEDKIK